MCVITSSTAVRRPVAGSTTEAQDATEGLLAMEVVAGDVFRILFRVVRRSGDSNLPMRAFHDAKSPELG